MDIVTMTREQYEGIIKDMEAQLRVEVDVRDDYSGRYMYGATCLAVCGGYDDLQAFLDAVHFYAPELGLSLRNMNQDSMGLGMVFYWPWVRVEEV